MPGFMSDMSKCFMSANVIMTGEHDLITSVNILLCSFKICSPKCLFDNDGRATLTSGWFPGSAGGPEHSKHKY